MNETIGNLRIILPSEREIATIGILHAPRQRVFDAYTQPELVKRWLGVFDGWTMEVCEIDLREGGTYRFVWRGPEGKSMGLRGVFHEVVSPSRLVSSETFDEPWYEGEAVGTLELVEHDDRTMVTNLMRFVSKPVRDSVLATGMNKGLAASFDKLAEVLASSSS